MNGGLRVEIDCLEWATCCSSFFCCEVVSGIQKVSERYSVLGSDAHLLIGVILAKKFCERFHRFDVCTENLESR